MFSYLRIHCGLDDTIGFTIPDMVEWCGGKPDKRTNGSNDKYLSLVDDLSKKGYLTYLTNKSKSSFMKCDFNKEHYKKECSNKYSVIYIDEFNKIMNYKKNNSRDNVVTNNVILLVFAYLRHKIVRRPNELKPEERYPEMIKERRERIPEAYNDNISNMSEEIGISPKTFSKIIDILECDLELIVSDSPYRIRNEEGEFRTPHSIFANAYKREKEYLLDTGKEYSRDEIELKAEKIKKYFKDYEINKNKRK